MIAIHSENVLFARVEVPSMPEDAIDMRLTAAEAEVVSMLRGIASQSYCLTVAALHGVWTVKLATIADGTVRESQGPSFGEAWAGLEARAGGPRRFAVIEGGRS